MQAQTLKAIYLTLFLVIPLNIYRIGNGLGNGIQWAFFKYQITPFGSMYFSIFQDLDYVITGIITGRSAFSLAFWSLGSLLLFSVCIIEFLLMSNTSGEKNKIFGLMTIMVGFFYLASCIFQYGPTLSGPAGFCFPFGVLIIWIFGIWVFFESSKIHGEDNLEENEDA